MKNYPWEMAQYWAKIIHEGRDNYRRYVTNPALPFAEGSFDAVVANFVFMEIEGLKEAMSEIARVLKPKGRLIFQILHSLYSASTQEIEQSKILTF